MHSTARTIAMACVSFIASLAAAAAVVAADFRVDSEVFAGNQTQPRSTNITLFHGDRVYDFLDAPPQISIYDLRRRRIVLVDPDRRLTCEVTGEMLSALEGNLRRTKSEDPLLRFSLEPSFDEQVDEQTKSRTFASKYITYRVTPAHGDHRDFSEPYRAFSDASARLNALVNRGSLPPFPRLAVNESLANAAEVPASLQVTIAPRQRLGGKSVVLRSQHKFRPRLSDSDYRKIEQAGATLADSRRVTLSEFLKPAASTAD
jgi:hypothetical protein